MYQMLQKGEWQIADTCQKLFEAIPNRMHDEKKPGDVLKVPGDSLHDVADHARYRIYTFITSTEKPRDLAVRDEMKAFAEQGDLTSAAIRYQQITEESQRSYQPATPRAGVVGGADGNLKLGLLRMTQKHVRLLKNSCLVKRAEIWEIEN
jgi:hypothetical protein